MTIIIISAATVAALFLVVAPLAQALCDYMKGGTP